MKRKKIEIALSTNFFDQVFAILTRLEGRSSAVWVSYLAISDKVEQMHRTTWQDPDLDRYANKIRMKEVGGSAISFTTFMHEVLLLALSKSLEDFNIDLKVTGGIKCDIWSSPQCAMFTHQAKTVSCIGNVIKHNRSFIEKSKSKSSKFLVDEAGYPDQTPLQSIFLQDTAQLALKDLPFQIHMYCLDVLRLHMRFEHPVLKLPPHEQRSHLAGCLVPPVLGLDID